MKNDVLEKIGKMYNEGKSIYEIADETGYKPNSIRSYLSKNGYNRKEVTQKFIENVKKMYLEDYMTAQEIADETGKCVSCIRNILSRNNIKKRDGEVYSKNKQFILDKYGEQYRDGKISAIKISVELFDMGIIVDYCTVLKLLNKNGYNKIKKEKDNNETINTKRRTREEYYKEKRERTNKFYEDIWKERTEQNMSINDIAKKHSKSSGYVSTCLSKIRKSKIESGEIPAPVKKEKEKPKEIIIHKSVDSKPKLDNSKKDKIDKPYLELDNGKVFYNGRVYELLKGKKLRRELRKVLNVVD